MSRPAAPVSVVEIGDFTPSLPDDNLSHSQSNVLTVAAAEEAPETETQTSPAPSQTTETHLRQQTQHRRSAGEVRRNFLAAFRSLPRTSKFFLFLHTFFMLANATVTIVILAISTSETCAAPLDVFLSVYVALGLIFAPIIVYQYLYPTPWRNQGNRTAVEKLKSSLEVVHIFWFIMGNYWISMPSTGCEYTAPKRYYLSVYYIVLGYLVLLMPVILILCIIFCLPSVLIVVRFLQRLFGIRLEPHLNNVVAANPFSRVQGLSQERLDEIPVEPYQPGETEIGEEDASCSICLAEYLSGDSIKRLPGCQHHFHADCANQWLAINKTCPLCVRDVEIELVTKGTGDQGNISPTEP